MMGRVIRSECVAIRCEIATPRGKNPSTQCDAVEWVTPQPASATWRSHLADLQRLVDLGWAFVLTPKIRAYCPAHADRVQECTCRTHPELEHLCPAHGDTRELVWTSEHTPIDVRQIGAAA